MDMTDNVNYITQCLTTKTSWTDLT